MAAPGVVVSTATRSGPTGVPKAQSGQYFVAGLTERGPVDAAVKVNSLGDYRRVFGDRVAYGTLYDDLQTFFEVGGKQAWVLRVVGAGATVGTFTLNDQAASPVPTLRVDAASPGSWSTRLTVGVTAGTTADTVKITVKLDGTIVHVYDNLATIDQIVSRFADSQYVRFTDLGSATVAPQDLPAPLVDTALSAGGDDRATVNAARIETQLPLLKIGLGDGAVAAPGFGESIHSALVAHAATNRRMAILTFARGTTVSDLEVAAASVSSLSNAEYAIPVAGWVQVPDGVGGVRTISPEGYVAAARAIAHEQEGPWQPAAGEGSISPYILGVDQEFTREDHELLAAVHVNPIRVVANKIRLYGWDSASTDVANYGSATVRDTLNRLVTECELRLEPFVFKTIDGRGHLTSQMQGVLIGVLEPIRVAGGVFERTDPVSGDVLDPGYSVVVSQDAASLANNEVKATVAARLSPNAALITLTIVKVGLTASV